MKIFKIGDRVFDARYGWGTFTGICVNADYPLYVQLDNGEYNIYTFDGKLNVEALLPSLSFTEYDYIKGGFSQDRNDIVDERIGKWGYFWDDDTDERFLYAKLSSIVVDSDFPYQDILENYKNFSLELPIK